MNMNLAQRLAMAGHLHNEYPAASFVTGFLVAAMMVREGEHEKVLAIEEAMQAFIEEHPDTSPSAVGNYEREMIAFLKSGDPADLGDLVRVQGRS